MKTLSFIYFLISAPTIFAHNLTSRSYLSCIAGMNRNDYPINFTEPHNEIPLWQVQDYVNFYLYTREYPIKREIKLYDASLSTSRFDFNRPTKIITHGYWSHSESLCCATIRDAFLRSGDYNVLVIDWWSMISIKRTLPIPYSSACDYVPMVASYVAKMINFLASRGLDLKTTTMVGYSLGAHMVGMASSKAVDKVDYIVGLEPALPGYESASSSNRLSIHDATTVHVIHTNEGDCGLFGPIGHYDFYANGGNKQPGCWVNSCAHSRSYELYAEAIGGSGNFRAQLCDDVDAARKGYCSGLVVVMNDDVRKQNASEGMYHFTTRRSPPYAMG